MFKSFNMEDKRFALFAGKRTRENRYLKRAVLAIQPNLLELYSPETIKTSLNSFATNQSTRMFNSVYQLYLWHKGERPQLPDNCFADQIRSIFARGPYYGRPYTGELTLAQYFIMIFHALGNDMWNKIAQAYEKYHLIVYKEPWLKKDQFVIDSSQPLPVPYRILNLIKEVYAIPLVIPDESEEEYESSEYSSLSPPLRINFEAADASSAISLAAQESALPLNSPNSPANFQANFSRQKAYSPMGIPPLPMNINIPTPNFASMHPSVLNTPHSENYPNGGNSGGSMTPMHAAYNNIRLDTFGTITGASDQSNRMDMGQQLQITDTSPAYDGSSLPMQQMPVFASPVLGQQMANPGIPSTAALPGTTTPLVSAPASSTQLNMLGLSQVTLQDLETINVALEKFSQKP
ncbi:hypothetical protein IWW36_005176 [Coemansia brasiliensis]|uniref:Uncharacterized protein n=1 Tax=Coemansia brasiliensis TaxID=2650707 RepID=A0A9W8LYC9_9FUNG|nr:hypothetical protein IWW36_005176 [Coemansia brasiliensis]